jgi:hypothetical protein
MDTALATKASFVDTNTALANQLELINTKADSTTFTNALNLKLNLAGGTMNGNLNMGGNRLI